MFKVLADDGLIVGVLHNPNSTLFKAEAYRVTELSYAEQIKQATLALDRALEYQEYDYANIS